jgi:hypothetical protein
MQHVRVRMGRRNSEVKSCIMLILIRTAYYTVVGSESAVCIVPVEAQFSASRCSVAFGDASPISHYPGAREGALLTEICCGPPEWTTSG